jgi:hypothetical protein
MENKVNNEEPSTSNNLKKIVAIAAQYINSQVDTMLDNAATVLNINPEQSVEDIVKEISMKMYIVNKALSTPQGQKILEELGKFSAEIFKTGEKPLKEGQRIFNDMLQAQMANVEKLAWGAVGLVPMVGDVVEVVKIAKDLLSTFVKFARAFASITGQGSDFIENVTKKINEKKALFMKLAKFITDTVTDLNKNVSSVMDNYEKELKSGLDNKMNNKIDNFVPNIVPNMNVNFKESDILKTKKGGMKCMNRVMKSQDEFLNLCFSKNKKNTKMRKRRKSTRKRH